MIGHGNDVKQRARREARGTGLQGDEAFLRRVLHRRFPEFRCREKLQVAGVIIQNCRILAGELHRFAGGEDRRQEEAQKNGNRSPRFHGQEPPPVAASYQDTSVRRWKIPQAPASVTASRNSQE